MSLKAFHIVFIICSILFTFGFGLWGLQSWRNDGGAGDLTLGILSLVAGIGLLVYGRYFLRKFKHISYL